MDDASLAQDVAREVAELHKVFQAWFRGEGPRSLDRVDRALAADFTMVAPDGTLIGRAHLMADLGNARGSRSIDIAIESQGLIWYSDGAALATYVEVQTQDHRVTRRRSTVLFRRTGGARNGLIWLHVHETWIEPPLR